MTDRAAAYNRGIELYRLGRASRFESQLRSAVRLLRWAVELAPAHSAAASTHFYLGASLALLGDGEAALAAYRRSLRLDPTTAACWRNIGVLHEQRQAWQQSAEAYRRAAQLEPSLRSEARQRAALGKALYHSGRPREGAAEFRRALTMAAEASPGDQAAILYKQGRAEELYGGSEPAASSNFSRAMDLALGDAAARWGSVLPPQLVSAWSDASGAVSRRVLSVGADPYAAAPVPNTGQQVCAERRNSEPRRWLYSDNDVVVARVRRPVWLCGNDAVLVSPGGPGAAPLIFVPFLAEQTEWHSQLPESLPAAPPAVGSPRWLPRGALVSQTFGVGFYHVLVDLLPRMLLARAHAADFPLIVQADEGGARKDFIVQLLALVGVPPEQLVPYEVRAEPGSFGDGRLAVGELVTIDWEWAGSVNTTARPGAAAAGGLEPVPPAAMRHCPPRYALRMARDWALDAVGVLHRASAPRVVVFVSRRRAETRKLDAAQEARLLSRIGAVLPSAGWRLLEFSDARLPPLREAIRLFASAAVVVGVHGAGLAHIAFSREGTDVIELALPEDHAHYYQHLSAALGLRYRGVPMVGRALYGAPTLPAAAVDEDAVVCAVASAVLAKGGG